MNISIHQETLCLSQIGRVASAHTHSQWSAYLHGDLIDAMPVLNNMEGFAWIEHWLSG